MPCRFCSCEGAPNEAGSSCTPPAVSKWTSRYVSVPTVHVGAGWLTAAPSNLNFVWSKVTVTGWPALRLVLLRRKRNIPGAGLVDSTLLTASAVLVASLTEMASLPTVEASSVADSPKKTST